LSVVTGLRKALILVCAMLMAASIPAAAQVIESPGTFNVNTLKPGQFVWFDEASAEPASYGGTDGPISIVISIPQQLAYVYRGGMLIAVSTVSTGRAGHATPTGDFTILQKQKFHRSNLYSNAPMPWMQRLTWDGIALHAGHLPGYPASHGCIRLPNAFARQLFAMTEMGAQVSVVDEDIVDPRLDPFAHPVMVADTSNLGGESFNVVTIGMGNRQPGRSRVTPPPPLVPVKDGEPVSWVTGPAREVVQPLPSGKR